MNDRLISRKTLTGSTKYDYCPYCVRQCEMQGKKYNEVLRPLEKVVIGSPVPASDGSITEYIDEHYECKKCGNTKITPETFRLYYTVRFDGTNWNEAPKDIKIWSAKKRCFVLGTWNAQKQTYVEKT